VTMSTKPTFSFLLLISLTLHCSSFLQALTTDLLNMLVFYLIPVCVVKYQFQKILNFVKIFCFFRTNGDFSLFLRKLVLIRSDFSLRLWPVAKISL
jgi:hypothetical protein